MQFNLTAPIYTDNGVFTLLNINVTHYSSSGEVKQLLLDSISVKRAEPRSKYQRMCIAISISYLKIHRDISILLLVPL